MLELLKMWALAEVLGLIGLPLAFMVFRNLPDRGWAFSKALGMVIFAFCVWFPLMCVHILPFSQLFLAGIFLIVLAGSLLGLLRLRHVLREVIRHQRYYILATELVFLGMVFLLGWMRAYGPDIRGFEMYMDEGFIASIMRSPHLPPNDMWFSGHSINYYYYAHYVIALLAKLIGQAPSVAFNTGICLFFGLCAVNLFGLTCNIVCWARRLRMRTQVDGTCDVEQPATVYPSLVPAIPYGLLSFLMALVFGNLAATRQWWINHDSGNLSGLWFDASRVIGNGKTINEFPAFSFLLSCFHAHVLTLAFTILAMGLIFNLFLEPRGRGLFAFGRGWALLWTLGTMALVIGGLFTMNGWDYPTYMALALVCLILQQWLAHNARFSLALFTNILLAGASLVVLSLALYLPFYLNFVSPSQGIGFVTPALRSTLNEELLIYGVFAFVFLSLLFASVLKRPLLERQSDSVLRKILPDLPLADEAEASSTLATPFLEVSNMTSPLPEAPLFSVPQASAAFVTSSTEPTLTSTSGLLTDVGHTTADLSLAEQQHSVVQVAEPEFTASNRLSVLFSARVLLPLGVLLYLVLCLLILKYVPNSATFVVGSSFALLGALVMGYQLRNRPLAFVLLLGATAFALVAFCEIFVLKDVFYPGDYERMNTVFKFYFQAWVLLSVACAVGLFFILDSFRLLRPDSFVLRWGKRSALALWSIFFLLLLAASLIYPLVAPFERYAHSDAHNPQPHLVHHDTLDGLAFMQSCHQPDCSYDASGDYAALEWLNTNIQGAPVIVEAMGDDYSNYARVSTFTGLPTLMGWWGHENQWRTTWFNNPTHPENMTDYQQRGPDIEQIYTNTDDSKVLEIMAHYQAEYLYVGALEVAKYPHANLARFSNFMQIVYNANGVTIYKVK